MPPIRFPRGGLTDVTIRPYAATGTLLGHFVVFGLEWRRHGVEIGFWLLPEARGRGVATRAVRTVCRWLFEALGTEPIEAATHVENARTQR